ncbi:MAG: hypothetical protein J0L75_05425 [Spirochaetes bacterium]|nr:hypothetical protein [Spirochaetota bacterium]
MAYEGGFIPFGELINPFPEQNVLGLLSPWLLQSSPSLRYNSAFASFFSWNDFSFAYRPAGTPDTFIGGVAFNRDLSRKLTLSGNFKFLSVDNIPSINTGAYLASLRLQSYSLTPSVSFKILPFLSASVETELSTLEFSGERSWDFNFSMSGAVELTNRLWIFEKSAFGFSARNLIGLFNSNTAAMQFQAMAGSRSWGDRLSYGVGVTMVPLPGALRPDFFGLDLAVSVFLFDLWRINLGLVGIGGEGMSFNASTSLTFNQFQFTFGLHNLAMSASAATVDKSKLELLFGLSIFYAPSMVMDNRKLMRELQKVNQFLERGRAEFEARRYREAISTYQACLQFKNDVDDAKRGLQEAQAALARAIDGGIAAGRRQIEEHDYLAAIGSLDQALGYDPANEVATRYRNLARQSLMGEKKSILERVGVFLKGKKLDEAKAQADAAFAIDPTDPQVQKAREDVDRAFAERVAEKEKQRKVQELLQIADGEMDKRNYEEAGSFYRQATNFGASASLLREWLERLAARKVKDERDDRVNNLFAKGQEALLSGTNLAGGLDLLAFALVLDPSHEAAREMMAKYDGARRVMVSNLNAAGLEAYRSSSWDEARSNFDRALALDPANVESQRYQRQVEETVNRKFDEFMGRAVAQEREGKLGEARQSYQAAQAVKPGDGKAKAAVSDLTARITSLVSERRDKAQLLFKDRKFAEAKATLLSLTRDFGADPQADALLEQIDVFVDAGNRFKELQVQFANRNFAGAKAIADRIHAVRPDFPGLADLKKRIDEEFERENREENLSKIFQDGVVEFKKKNWAAAIAKWEEVRKLDPKNELVSEYVEQANQKRKEAEDRDYTEGVAAFEKKDFLLARERFQAAVKANPKNEPARKYLADLQFELENLKKQQTSRAAAFFKAGQYEETLKVYELLKRIDGDAFDQEDAVYRNRNAIDFLSKGETAKRGGNLGKALGLFKSVLEMNPDDPLAQRQVQELANNLKKQKAKSLADAEASYKAGDFQTSMEIWRSVVALEGTSAGEKAELEERIDQTAQKRRNIIDTKSRQAAAEEEAGRLARAIELWQELLSVDRGNVTASRRVDALSARLEGQRQAAAFASRRSANELFEQGVNAYAQENYAEAISAWEQVLAVNADDARARQYILRAKAKLALKGK